ncbi:MAG: hemolysin family protein [Alphaproteobacteria bacterium]
MPNEDRRTIALEAVPTTPPAAAAKAESTQDRNEGWIERLRLRLGLRPKNSVREDLEEVLEEDAPSVAGFTEEERSMLRNILELRERRAEDLAVPRADIIAVQKDIPLGELLQLFHEVGHTRLVVYDDTLDDPVGVVHIKDVMGQILSDARKAGGKRKPRGRQAVALDLGLVALDIALSSTRLVRPVLFVPPSMRALDLLEKMQASRIPIALIVDEYGGTDGLVAVKDIVESIVGDIEDEHDGKEGAQIVAAADGGFVADARAMLEEVAAALGPDFEPGEEATDEVDTLGGYLTVIAGHVPVRGEVVLGPAGFEFEVMDADPRRVKRVRITRNTEEPGEEAPVESTTSSAPAALPAPQTQPIAKAPAEQAVSKGS